MKVTHLTDFSLLFYLLNLFSAMENISKYIQNVIKALNNGVSQTPMCRRGFLMLQQATSATK